MMDIRFILHVILYVTEKWTFASSTSYLIILLEKKKLESYDRQAINITTLWSIALQIFL